MRVLPYSQLYSVLPQVLPGPQLRGSQQDAQGQAKKVLTEGTLAAAAAAAAAATI